MKQLNTYSYANGEVADAENLIECIEANRRGYASISIYNLSGTDIPVIKAGSTAEIGGTIYTAEADETARFYDGTSFYAADCSHVPAGKYLLALVPASASSSEVTELVLCIMSAFTCEYNQSYRGWYQPNTLNRVIGGMTITNSGAAISASDKWLMTNTHMSYTLENPADPYFRLYSDGVEGVLRINKNKINVYSNASTVEHVSTPVTLVNNHLATCPQWLVVTINAVGRDYSNGGNYGNLFSATGTIALIALDADGNELDTVSTRTIAVNSTAKEYEIVFHDVNPGNYKVRFTPSVYQSTYSPGPNMTIQIGVAITTTSISVDVQNTYGARKGTY